MRKRKNDNYLGGGFYDIAGEMYHKDEKIGMYKCKILSIVGDLYTYECFGCHQRYEKFRCPKL